MAKYRVATSASYFNNPAVRRELERQDLILTTHSEVVGVLAKLFDCPVVCISRAVYFGDLEQITSFINSFYRGCDQIAVSDLEVTGFSELRKLNAANSAGAECGLAELRAMFEAQWEAVTAIQGGV